MPVLREMLAGMRRASREEGPAEIKARPDAGEPLVLIDVRDPDEYRDGYIEPAVSISRGFLEFTIATAAPDPTVPSVLDPTIKDLSIQMEGGGRACALPDACPAAGAPAAAAGS